MREKWPRKSAGRQKEPSAKSFSWMPSMALVRARWRFAWRVANGQAETASETRRAIDAVLEENAETLMRVPGVVGTALSESSGQPCVRVLVEKMTPELLEQIPAELEGYTVAVEEAGESGARVRD